MPLYKSTYHSKIYRDFREIGADNYRKLIHFYEQREEAIRALDFEEYFELLMAYTDALFEVGFYQKYLLMVDVAIELVIMHDVKDRSGEDLYLRLLFRKAAAHFRCLQYDKCDYVLRELLRIDPHHGDAALFLRKCLRHKNPALLRHAKAAAIFCFLLSALVICIEVLFVRPFYDVHTDLVEMSRNSIFGLGCALLFGGLLLHRLQAEYEAYRFVRRLRNS